MIEPMRPNPNNRTKAIIVAIVLAMTFVLMGAWIRMMEESLDTFQQVYLRVFLAGIFALFIFRRKLSKSLFKQLSRRESD